MLPPTDFAISLSTYEEAASDPLSVKLQSNAAELNIWLKFSDVAAILSGIPGGDGVHALAAGTSANAQAFWALGGSGELFIVVGHDDETWDFGVTLSPRSRDELLRELEAFHAKVMRSNTSLERMREG
ncbi:MAG: hypothetical protein ACAF41_23620 [Leptolyngbya sp. BL-A-14]